MSPAPTRDGIRISIDSRPNRYDYWALRTDGSFYLFKSLFEEAEGVSDRLFFDTRVVRTTELCMFLSGLYARLGAPDDSQLYLSLEMRGLRGARLTSSNGARVLHERGPATEDSAFAEITTSLRNLRNNMSGVVKTLLQPVFVIFDFFELNESVYESIVNEYRQGGFT